MKLAFGLAALLVAAPSAPAGASTPSAGVIRLDQVGYGAGEVKQAYLLTPGVAGNARFEVLDSRGEAVQTGRTAQDRGPWNGAYRHVYVLDFSGLSRPGTYRIKLGKVRSPSFTIDPVLPARATAGFFTTQRDGADIVPGALGRKPAHLNDRKAHVYAWPTFTGPDTDEYAGTLKRLPGPAVDVEGGWFDAGDFLKFTHTTAFATTLLWASRRDGSGSPELTAESQHGLDWLDKMWDSRTKTLYIQVGVGGDNKAGTVIGDHSTWRLPEKDDSDTAKGHQLLRHRPVFRAGNPGAKLSPNLAGRVSAAFALAAQTEPDQAKARGYLETAAEIYGQADTRWKGRLVTALPYSFYPESAWHDDMELGGAELGLAARRLGDPRAESWLAQSRTWAAAYLAKDAGKDTFNLYDVSALAHADLIKACGVWGADAAKLRADLRAQLRIGLERSAKDPFRAGAVYADFDAVPHTFGLAATARLYGSVTGSHAYDRFATTQRNWVFGANPWGVSFVIGSGSTYVRCPQHVVANLKGTAVGAVVNGPNGKDQFADGLGGHLPHMKKCGVPRLAAFDGKGSRFVDDVRSWQSTEPALDFTALGTYALSLF